MLELAAPGAGDGERFGSEQEAVPDELVDGGFDHGAGIGFHAVFAKEGVGVRIGGSRAVSLPAAAGQPAPFSAAFSAATDRMAERCLVAADRGEHGLHVAGRERDAAQARDEIARPWQLPVDSSRTRSGGIPNPRSMILPRGDDRGPAAPPCLAGVSDDLDAGLPFLLVRRAAGAV